MSCSCRTFTGLAVTVMRTSWPTAALLRQSSPPTAAIGQTRYEDTCLTSPSDVKVSLSPSLPFHSPGWEDQHEAPAVPGVTSAADHDLPARRGEDGGRGGVCSYQRSSGSLYSYGLLQLHGWRFGQPEEDGLKAGWVDFKPPLICETDILSILMDFVSPQPP